MTKQVIVTTPHNSGLGDAGFTAFEKTNSNFTDVYQGAATAGTGNLTLAALTALMPPASFTGYTQNTSDQGLVTSSGVAWILNADTSVKAALLTGSSNATANATAIMNAATGGNITVKIPAGTFYVGPMVFQSNGTQIQGEGQFSTTLIFVPTGNTAVPGYGTTDPGSCFMFCNNAGQSILYNCSLRRMTIQSTDTTFTKAAVRSCETSQLTVEDVFVSGFLGQNSVGVWTQGHEMICVGRMEINACVPVRMSPGLKAYGTVLTGVQITGVAGQFSCNAGTLVLGQSITISGTFGGTGSITGYTDPTTYSISATNGTTTFTLVTQAGAALVTTAGTPTGLTYNNGVTFTDHFHFYDLYLLTGLGAGNVKTQGATFYPTTLNHACVLMDDNMVVTNLMFDGRQAWVGGQYGFFCSNTLYAGSINFNWSFKNVRKEQGYSNAQMCHYINTSSVQVYNPRQMYWENCYNAEGFTGWALQGLWFITMVNCMSPVLNGGFFVVDANTNILGMQWVNMWCNSTDTNNVSLSSPINGSYYSGYILPFTGSWVNGAFPIAGLSKSIQAPTSGTTVTIAVSIDALILNPAGVLATLTITLPPTPNDRQEINISTTQQLTALTINGAGGATVLGWPNPTQLNPGGIRFYYQSSNTTWYRLN